MRLPVISAAALCFTLGAFNGLCQQTRPVEDGTQAHKEWELAARNRDLEKRDGGIDDAAVLKYGQQLADRVSGAASVPTLRVRVTRGAGEYASVSAQGVLYLSAGLFSMTEDEAELTGIIAHELAHLSLARQPGPSWDAACILDPFHRSDWADDWRERENQATKLAVSYLKAAGFDPTSLLSLLSKLAYGHPVWARAIRAEDLLDLRSILEDQPIPPQGYRLDSSDFAAIHATIAKAVVGVSR